MISKKLLIGGINADDSHLIIDTKDYLNALNFRFATSENGNVGEGSNVEGTTVKNNGSAYLLPDGNNETIGAYEDRINRRLFFFNKNSNGDHGIYCYHLDDDYVYEVLMSSQVVGGLNFSSFIHSVAMFDNQLYWTDGVNWQRRINVDAALKLNDPTYPTSVVPYVLDQNSNTQMSASVINLIRNQPWAPLSAAKTINAGVSNNFIKNEAFQFSYRFVYRDGEVSAFSPLSKLINFNTASENTSGYNGILVKVPLTQYIDQDVNKVEIAVKYAVGGSTFIVKEFSSGFSAHNAGTQLSFTFYNDSVGIAVDGATAVKVYDYVPVTSGTLDIAKNRLFLGDNTSGYDTPTYTSLTSNINTVDGVKVYGQWFKIRYEKDFVIHNEYCIYTDNAGGTYSPGYYFPPSQPSLPIPSTSVSISTLTYAGPDQGEVAGWLSIPPSKITYLEYYGPTIELTGSGLAPLTTNDINVFKTDSTYKLGVVFYDQAGRSSGVVTAGEIKIPDRAYNTTVFTTGVNWSLDNADNPTVQIPSWAHSYSIVRTKSLRASQFAQLRSDGVLYVQKNVSTGELTTYTGAYDSKHYGVAIDVRSLFGVGIGYSFNEGDMIKIYVSGGNTYNVAIKATFGSYIVTELIDLGYITTSTTVSCLYEFYTPYIGSTYELYYEVGETYSILNPGENTRKFSAIAGTLRGDVYLLKRNSTYYVEAMSLLDTYWSKWNTDIGRPNIVLSSGQTRKPLSVYYSNVRMSGTENNGLSTFETLSQYTLPSELKAIKRLILSSKVQFEGNVMLAIGEQETAVVYVGEAQLFDNTGNSFLASTTGVIGNVNVLRGSYGTIHPESAFRWGGHVVYFDANKGEWVRYDVNGLTPISRNKMSKYFHKSAQDIMMYFRDNTEYNYANPVKGLRVLGGVDPYHEEFLSSMPRMYLNPKNTILTDMEMSSSTYSFTTVEAAISRTTSSLSFSYTVGAGPSTSSSFTFTGTNLTVSQSITVTGSTNFEVSKDNVSFSSSVSYPYTGINKSGTVYVRMKSGLAVGSYGSQSITISGGGATNTVAVSGTVNVAVIPYLEASVAYLSDFNYISGSGPSSAQSFTIVASTLSPSSGNITISASTSYEVSVTSGTSGFSSSSVTLAYTSGGTLASNTVWVRLKAGLSIGSYGSQTISISGGGASDSVIISGSVSATPPTYYSYDGSGYGGTSASACDMASFSPVTLYSTTSSSSFGIGSVVYINNTGSILTGAYIVFMNGSNWDTNSYGVVTGLSSNQC